MLSVTSLKNIIFEPFDEDNVINTNYYKWKLIKENKYYNLINFMINNLNFTDEKCKHVIKSIWDFKGKYSIARGKILHKLIENDLENVDSSENEKILNLYTECNNQYDPIEEDNVFNPSLFYSIIDEEDRNAICDYLTCNFIKSTKHDKKIVVPLTYNYIKEEYESFKQWRAQYFTNVKLYKTEWKIKSEHLNLVGVIDAVFSYNDSPNELLIVDWKRNGNIELENPMGKMGLKPPFDVLPDCNFGHYSLQLNVYGRMVELSYAPLKVRKMLIVQIINDKIEEYEVKRLF